MLIRLSLLTALLALPCLFAHAEADENPAFAFEMKEIDKGLDIGYAVLLVDINADKKTDIVVVDTHQVVWYENPTWKKRIILDKTTKPHNVCISAADIDGDGKLDLAIGAEWAPFNTKSGGTVQWVKQPDDLEKPWKMYPIGEEPTMHRIRFADVDGNGKPVLIVGPLMGKNSTKEKFFEDGSPLRLLAYRIPKDPTRDRWIPDVIDESLHVMHNFDAVPAKSGKGVDILTASYDGVFRFERQGEKWLKHHVGTGNQEKRKDGKRGASEIKRGKLKRDREFIATIEPWHGHQVVMYTPPEKAGELWTRQVLDEKLLWGHAVWCADLDGDGAQELVIGVRDDLSKNSGERRGIRVYKAQDEKGTKWTRQIIEDGGVAVEDAACADLDGDGKIDIVAVGRQTKNVRIYRNVGKK